MQRRRATEKELTKHRAVLSAAVGTCTERPAVESIVRDVLHVPPVDANVRRGLWCARRTRSDALTEAVLELDLAVNLVRVARPADGLTTLADYSSRLLDDVVTANGLAATIGRLEKREDKPENEIAGRREDRRMFRYLRGYVVVAAGRGRFEVALAGGGRAVLGTMQTPFTSGGRFALEASRMGSEIVRKLGGLTAKWPYFMEAIGEEVKEAD